MRTLVKTNHDVLPSLLEPNPLLEYNAQIYSQVRIDGLLSNQRPSHLVEEAETDLSVRDVEGKGHPRWFYVCIRR